jgi:hypothetical protein
MATMAEIQHAINEQHTNAQTTVAVRKELENEGRASTWPPGWPCTYYTGAGANQVGLRPKGWTGPQTVRGMHNIVGYCVTKAEAEKDIKAHVGKACKHLSGAASKYNAKGECIPNSTLADKTPSSNTLETPTIAEPQAVLQAGMGGIPTWMILAGGAAALFFFIRSRRNA